MERNRFYFGVLFLTIGSTGLITWTGHRKEILKLTFRALALRRSDWLETSFFESLYGGQFTLSTQLIKPKSCYTSHRRNTTVSGPKVAYPIIYRLIPSPSWYEIWQCFLLYYLCHINIYQFIFEFLYLCFRMWLWLPSTLDLLDVQTLSVYCRFSHDVTKIQTTTTIDPPDILLQWCIRAAEI